MIEPDQLRKDLDAHLQSGLQLCKEIIDREQDTVSDGIGLFTILVQELLEHEDTARSRSETGFFVGPDRTIDFAYRYAILAALLLAISHFFPRYRSEPRKNSDTG